MSWGHLQASRFPVVQTRKPLVIQHFWSILPRSICVHKYSVFLRLFKKGINSYGVDSKKKIELTKRSTLQDCSDNGIFF